MTDWEPPEWAVEAAARAMMAVTARRPADPCGLEYPVLCSDPDYDDLPRDASQGTTQDEITQEAVLKLARAALVAAQLEYVARGAVNRDAPDAD